LFFASAVVAFTPPKRGSGGNFGNGGSGKGGKGDASDFEGFGPAVVPMGFFGSIWDKYNEVLDDQPLVTKACTSLVGFSVGDILAQKFINKGSSFDFKRLARLSSFGFLIHGPMGHYFYGWLDGQIPGTDTKSVISKVAIDQLLMNPVFGTIFFTYLGLVSGDGPDKILAKLKKDLWTAVKGSWTVWPIAHAINFKFIPSSQRLLYINSIQILYNVFLSVIGSK